MTLKSLFFNVSTGKHPGSFADSLMKVGYLHYVAKVGCSWSLNISIEMSEPGAQKCVRTFLFTKSPVPGLSIESGSIKAGIGLADTLKKLLSIEWMVQFTSEKEAKAYFNKIKQLFSAVSAKRKYGYYKSIAVHYAGFSEKLDNREDDDDIFFLLSRSKNSGKYQIELLLPRIPEF